MLEYMVMAGHGGGPGDVVFYHPHRGWVGARIDRTAEAYVALTAWGFRQWLLRKAHGE